MKYLKKIKNWYNTNIKNKRIQFIKKNVLLDLEYYKNKSETLQYNNEFLKNNKDIDNISFETRRGKITLITEPTDNCQVFCMGNFHNMAYLKKSKVKSIVSRIHGYTYKTLLIVDINAYIKEDLFENVKGYFEIITESNYFSTNGSNMILCLLSFNPEYKPEKEIKKEVKILKSKLEKKWEDDY